MSFLRALIARLSAYTHNDDPRTQVACSVAMIVASNQPFYPLYLHYVAGWAAWPIWLSLLTTPFFLAVPAVARRDTLAGRAMLPLVGIANNILCLKLIGARTAVELFYLPCMLLAALLFRKRERLVMWPLLGLPYALYFLLDGVIGAPIAQFADDRYASLASLNAVSVASLIALIGLLTSAAISPRDD